VKIIRTVFSAVLRTTIIVHSYKHTDTLCAVPTDLLATRGLLVI